MGKRLGQFYGTRIRGGASFTKHGEGVGPVLSH